MSKVKKFIELQDKANEQIATKGECSVKIANQLEKLSNELTTEEQDIILMHYEII